MTLYERLSGLADEKYKDFQSKLVPNIPKDTMIGVRTPDLRMITKELRGTEEAEKLLAELPHKQWRPFSRM